MGFRYFLYNPETGEILSRTPISWAKIIIFYCIYYTCLGLSSTITPKTILAAYYSWIIFLSSRILDWMPSHLLPHCTWGPPQVPPIIWRRKKWYWLSFSLTFWFQMDTGCFHHWQQPRFLTKNFLQRSEYWKQIEMPSQTLYSRDKKSFFQALDFDRVLLMNVLTPPCLRLRFLSSISISSPLILLLHWGSGIF